MLRSSTRYVEPFRAARPDPARLGGKGASLVRLVALGHRVPPGFALSVDAFRIALDRLGLRPAVERLSATLGDGGPDLLNDARVVEEGLRDGAVPAEVLDEVQAAVEDLDLWESNPDGLIVRSSATAEDSSALSFAGIFESIPIGSPEELEPAIREVWRSVFSPRAVAYVRESGLRFLPEMGVVVQRFLQAERSGVMFTRFRAPGGADRILVEHVEGGCEKLVKGEVTPERLWMDPGSSLDVRGDDLLADVHAAELARVAGSLEEAFGAPQDVEWCVHDGLVHVVQSRPITSGALPAAPVVAAPATAEPILAGVPASGGIGSGPVHLVFNIEQALQLERGQVLVTPMTNPDMVVAMRNSAGIVTDVGGMICHAAIVSRELGLPCVVGTETATRILRPEQLVTVVGHAGEVYDGRLEIESSGGPDTGMEWADLWSLWTRSVAGHPGTVPVVSSVDALGSAPSDVAEVVLAPDVDLRTGPVGLWNDLEAVPAHERGVELDAYCRRVVEAAAAGGIQRVWIVPPASLQDDVAAAVARCEEAGLRLHEESDGAPPVGPDLPLGTGGPAAVPVGAALVRAESGPKRPSLRPPEEALRAAFDTLKFFGHRPGVRVAAMPDSRQRGRWWELLPEYGRYHQEFRTDAERGEFEWLEVRPELVISSLLKSLVQPGFEMVPRVMGFAGLSPMHIKWIRCRYHFRADTFDATWRAIVRATWDRAYMADLMRRVRRSYAQLEEVLELFPQSEEDLRTQPGPRLAALVTSWWTRWVEFFALCWFIQAQGDDIAYPFVDETVRDALARLPDPPPGLAWPGPQDLVAPTTPVMSGAYMADVSRLRETLVSAGLTDPAAAEAAVARGDHVELERQVGEHLARWHWMRDRDLLFEPWDTADRVIRIALETEPHVPAPYERNLRRNVLALAFHCDLARSSGRSAALNHHARFLHDLNVERENHHVLWLKFSYPLRRVVVEIERRLIEVGSLVPGDVFFLQAPELIDAARRLPAPLSGPLAARARNRRLGYLVEARLAPEGHAVPVEEDDYY